MAPLPPRIPNAPWRTNHRPCTTPSRESAPPCSRPPALPLPNSATAAYSRFSRSPVSLSAPHSEFVLPFRQRLNRIAAHVHEARNPRRRQRLNLILRIARHQHRHSNRRTNLLRQRQILAVG